MPTIIDHFFDTAKRYPKRPAFRYSSSDGLWKGFTWSDARERVLRLASWLADHGVQKGSRVAIWSMTRFEWTLCDMAILTVGATTVPIYHNIPQEQVDFILRDSGCRVMFYSGRNQSEVAANFYTTGLLDHVISLDRESLFPKSDWLGDICDGQGSFSAPFPKVDEREIATIVYTSGTTGDPKGVILTHRNIMAEIRGLKNLFPIDVNDSVLTFLPLAHIVARAVQYFQISVGCEAIYAESMERLAANLVDGKPTFFATVPRLLEKIHERVQAELMQKPAFIRSLFNRGIEKSKIIMKARRVGDTPPFLLRMEYGCYKKFFFKKIQQKLGGRVRFIISGGAALPEKIGRFFEAIGIPVIEGYGLTETTAAATVNSLGDYHIGTVGKAIDGVQIKLAEDGEILIKGDSVFLGYLNHPEESRQAFTDDRWFKTGDIGSFSKEGFLRITDRKKDLIKTSGGKYISPQRLEMHLTASPFVSQSIIIGEGRKYISALIVPNREAIEKFASSRGVHASSWESLIQHQEIIRLIAGEVESANKLLAQFESIKKFAIIAKELTIESNEVTPTMKVKRKIVQDHYRHTIDHLYGDA